MRVGAFQHPLADDAFRRAAPIVVQLQDCVGDVVVVVVDYFRVDSGYLDDLIDDGLH